MIEARPPLELSQAYQDELAAQYGPDIVARIEGSLHFAPARHVGEGEYIPYLRLRPAEPVTSKPTFYVPGFAEGIVAKLPFAAEMASHGIDLIIPGKHRTGILKDVSGRKSATHSEAMNNLAVLREEGLTHGPVDVITHSYGALIFQAMHWFARAGKLDTFKDAKVAMLAPAGTNERELLPGLGARFGLHLITEAFSEKDFSDVGGDMMKRNAEHLLANIPRTLREVWELSRLRMDYPELASSDLGEIKVFGYAEDKVFPHRVKKMMLAEAVDYGVGYATPVSLRRRLQSIRGGQGATHNDEQFNPSRVAGSLLEFLTAA